MSNAIWENNVHKSSWATDAKNLAIVRPKIRNDRTQ